MKIKSSLLLFLFVIVFLPQCFARLNENRAKLLERYGKPEVAKMSESDIPHDWQNRIGYSLGHPTYWSWFSHFHDFRVAGVTEVSEGFADPKDWECLLFKLEQLRIRTCIYKDVCLLISYESYPDLTDLIPSLIENNGLSIKDVKESDSFRHDSYITSTINGLESVLLYNGTGCSYFVSPKWYELRADWITKVKAFRKANEEKEEADKKEKEAQAKKNLLEKL